MRIEVFDLPALLRAIWICGLRPKKFVAELVKRIEEVEGLVFKNRNAIFEGGRR